MSLEATKVPSAGGEAGPPAVESVAELPPILMGHATPEVKKRTEKFYSTVAAMFEAWIERRQNPNTQRAYRVDVMSFVEFMGIRWPEESHKLLKTTVPQVQAWRDWLVKGQKTAPSTLNRKVSSLSGFFKFMREAANEQRLPINVPNPAHAQFIGRETQKPVKETQALSVDKARTLLALVEGDSVLSYRDRAILAFYLYTGARIATGCRLKVEDFHQDEDEGPSLRIQEKGKGVSKRRLGINLIAGKAIAEYIEKAGLVKGPLFRPRKAPRSEELGERPFDTSTMYRLLMGYLRKLPRAVKKVEAEGGTEKEECIYKPHSLRATTASLLSARGVDIRRVRDLLGHSSVTITETYEKVQHSTKESASHLVPI